MSGCNRSFDEALLSGFVDAELTQADRQKVGLHLEECPECSSLVEDLRQFQEAARTTAFVTPADEEWLERPRSALSFWLRRSGWILVAVWLIVASWFAIGGFLADDSSWLEKSMVLILGGGGGLLFLSVLLDRLQALKTDRYGRVQK